MSTTKATPTLASITPPQNTHDLIFIIDTTASMFDFVLNLKNTLPQVFDIIKLTNIFNRISVLAYYDYDLTEVIKFSGWHTIDNTDFITSFVKNLKTIGGGTNNGEAVKTGLNAAFKLVDKPTICIMYLDEQPHHKFKNVKVAKSLEKEILELGETNFDWLHICKQACKLNITVFPFFPDLKTYEYPFFTTLASMTRGQCFKVDRNGSIQPTVGVILNIAGIAFKYDDSVQCVSQEDGFNPYKYFANGSEKNMIPPVSYAPKVLVNKAICASIGDLVKKFDESKEYEDIVYSVFDSLLNADRVLAFTYNTLFGKLWRSICSRRQDERRNNLMSKLSRTVNKLSDADRKVLQTFIDESYNKSARILDIFAIAGNVGPYYVIDSGILLQRKVVFEIGLSCAPSVVKTMLKTLAEIRISNLKPKDVYELPYIPINVSPEMTFKILPHLVCPGSMFSTRLSAIIAIISKISGSILQDKAVEYLKKIQGKWIDLTLPENNSLDFARLVLRVADIALTEKENKYLRILLKVGQLKKSKDRDLNVEVSYSSYKNKRPDIKEQCKKCNQWRSMTSIVRNTCTLCIEYTEKKCPETDQEKSWMCECKTCLVQYAVYHPDNLRCPSKCHFCRLKISTPFVECNLCMNKFLYQKSGPIENFTCAVCAVNEKRVTKIIEKNIYQYISQNKAGFIGMNIENVEHFFDPANKISATTEKERKIAVRNLAEITEADCMNHKIKFGQSSKDVWNVKDLQKQIFEIFSKPEISTCMFCFDNFSSKELMLICSKKKNSCTSKACAPCLKSWYNQLQPGEVCQPGNLLCPYCKKIPSLKIVEIFNRQLCELINISNIQEFDPSYIYAWCLTCYKIKIAHDRECGNNNIEIKDFNCEDCMSKPESNIRKKCPKCYVLTEKTGGCNHIECLNRLKNNKICYQHWCWVCNKKLLYKEIYRHLSIEHGGFFDD